MNTSIQDKMQESQFSEDRIDLIKIFTVLWEAKLFILSLSSVFAISSILYALSLNNYYVSSSVLVSADSQNTSALSQYSGLASLAGIGIQSPGNTETEIMEIIKSRKFVKHLISYEGVLQAIMAPESYNRKSKTLNFNTDIYDPETNEWKREPRVDRPSKPSYLEVHKLYTKRILSISKDKKTSVINISIEHISPVFAKDFLTLIIKEANATMRQKDI